MTKKKRLRKEALKPSKVRKEAWMLSSDEAVGNAGAMILQLADATGQSLEEVAESLWSLERDGYLKRQEDGSLLLYAPTGDDHAA